MNPNEFVGRTEALDRFHEWWEDPDKRLLLIEGKPRIGKTWLAHYFRTMAGKLPPSVKVFLIDCTAQSAPPADEGAMLALLRRKIQEPAFTAPFLSAEVAFRTEQNALATATAPVNEFESTAIAAAIQKEFATLQSMPGNVQVTISGKVRDLHIGPETVFNKGAIQIQLIRSNPTVPAGGAEPFLEAKQREYLFGAIAKALMGLAAAHPVLLVIDHLNGVPAAVRTWVRDWLLPVYLEDFASVSPLHLVLVSFAFAQDDPRAADWERLNELLTVTPLTEVEVRHYCMAVHGFSEAQATDAWETTQGLPEALAQWARREKKNKRELA